MGDERVCVSLFSSYMCAVYASAVTRERECCILAADTLYTNRQELCTGLKPGEKAEIVT